MNPQAISMEILCKIDDVNEFYCYLKYMEEV
jgi:hypothetical protein